GLEGGRAAALHRLGRVRHRRPAVAQLDGAADGATAVAADPDRRPRTLGRARQHAVAGGREVTAVEDDGLPRPRRLHGADGLVGELVALVEVDAEDPE